MVHVFTFRFVAAGLLAVALLSGHSWAAAPIEKPGLAAEAAEAKPAALEQIKAKVDEQPRRLDLDARPNSLSINATSSFNEDGDLNSRHFRCTLSVRLKAPAADNVVGIDDVQVVRVVGDDGEALDLENMEPIPPSNVRPADDNRDFSGYVNINLPDGVMRCAALSRVEITLNVVQQIGKRIEVTLPELDDVIGRPVRIEGAGEKPMSIKFTRAEGNNHMVYIEARPEDMARLVEVHALKADGATRKLSVGTHTHNGVPRRYVHVHQMGNDDRLQLQVLEGVRIKEHRVVMRDLEMPFAPPEAKQKKEPLVIHVGKQGNAVVGAPEAKQGDGNGELRVLVE